MKIIINNEDYVYMKMYPTSTNSADNPSALQEWSGTGFALNHGYVVTNYHVIENAKSVSIQGISGDFSTQYNATIVATDKNNDLALLQITDTDFKGFGSIPYNVKTTVSDVGEDIFVLGYPLTGTMGNEIKLTTGVISSKTGFQGDVSLYQISAPIQPGNSGGPLFDQKGNLIGVVNAKHKGAENVGYAIKTSYLKNLIESSISTSVLPYSNTTEGMPLTDKVKCLKNFVFIITCSIGLTYGLLILTILSFTLSRGLFLSKCLFCWRYILMMISISLFCPAVSISAVSACSRSILRISFSIFPRR